VKVKVYETREAEGWEYVLDIVEFAIDMKRLDTWCNEHQCHMRTAGATAEGLQRWKIFGPKWTLELLREILYYVA
jgi:hypothetical protein